jgi:ABC-type phosphate transport system substrate-binding protein
MICFGAFVSVLVMLTAPLGGVAASVQAQNMNDKTVVANPLLQESQPALDETDTEASFVAVDDQTQPFPGDSETGFDTGIAARGASFQANIMELYTNEYSTDVNPDVATTYVVTGSSGGQRGFFGFSEAAASDDDGNSESDSGDCEDFIDAGGVKGFPVPADISGAQVDSYDCPTQTGFEGTTAQQDRSIFSASDAPPTQEDYVEARHQGGTILTLPNVIGSVSVSYDIPELVGVGNVHLTGEMISDMYLGEITKWNDPAIVDAQDPAVADVLQGVDEEVVPTHRCDGSGTTYAFTDYLARSTEDGWQADEEFSAGSDSGQVDGNSGGTDTEGTESDAQPVGETLNPNTQCGNDNQGVADSVDDSDDHYEFGYVEFGEAQSRSDQPTLALSELRNRDDTAWVEPSIPTASAAAAGAIDRIPAPWGDFSDVSIAFASDPANPGQGVAENAYPIGTFSYIWLWANPAQAEHGGQSDDRFWDKNDNTEALDDGDGGPEGNELSELWTKEQWSAARDFLTWMMTDGQDNNPEVGFAPIPPVLQERNVWAIENLTPWGPAETIDTDKQTEGFAAIGHQVTLSEDGYTVTNVNDRGPFSAGTASGADVTLNNEGGNYVNVETLGLVSSSQTGGSFVAAGADGTAFTGTVQQDCDLGPSTEDVYGQVIDNSLVLRGC